MPFEKDTDNYNQKIINLSKENKSIHGFFWIQKHRIQDDLAILKIDAPPDLLFPVVLRGDPAVRWCIQYPVRHPIQPEELLGVGAAHGTDQGHHDDWDPAHAAAGDFHIFQGVGSVSRATD